MDLSEFSAHIKNQQYTRHPWEQARLEFVYKLINKHTSKRTNPVFLDIGSGDTFVAENLLKKIPASTFYCVDTAFTEEHIQYYSKKFSHINIQVFNSLETALVHLKSDIDFVLALDVMEHVANDLDFLKDITHSDKVTKKTQIILTVPAFQSLFSHHDVILGHYRRYTNNTLKQVANKAGLEIISIGYFFISLLIPRTLIKLKEKIISPRSKKTSVAEWHRGTFVTSIYKNILIFDFRISFFLEKIHLKPIGLSNYMVCKKSV
ncbi:methyltransferase domain-containing protein [Xanthomarina sp. F2636L]|uniref:methyltransferase domain-containing protein n=1 Tax=Xanthomarina sp. F2636L TaxID=2996018 RepID=UPI00225E306D|nr:class I SAM-dependent methyltransferase [Xanthomarina sp. F2636L]MCX7550562.1 class I SAM-dependent methyltransferase [Xanthomarina sp. F2636L]